MGEVSDPFLWLENLEDPKVIEWALKRDKTIRNSLKQLSRKLKPRIEKFFKTPYTIMVKITKRGCLVLSREAGVYKIKLITFDGNVKELVNSESLGKDVVIQMIHASKDGKQYAFSYSHGGSDEGILKVVDLDSGESIDELRGVIGGINWIDESKYYYLRFYQKGKTPDGVDAPAERAFLRENGKDFMVFGEGIPTSHFITLNKSLDRKKALIMVSYGWTKSSVYGGDFENPEEWKMLYGGKDFITYPIDYVNGEYFIASFEGEGLGKILALNEKGDVREVVGEQKYPLQEAVIAENSIIASYLIDASSALKKFKLDGKEAFETRFKPLGRIDSLDSDGTKVVFRYESFLIPYRIYLMEKNEVRIIDSNEISGDFAVSEGWVSSKDSTKIHFFEVKKKGLKPKHVVAYGYGGFSVSLSPRFYPYIIPFLQDGGVFVQANLRGGVEYGEKWHRAGMREKKQNVFDDFIAVLEHVKSRGCKTVAMGISNGGLLVGAILTQRPDLIDGAVIGYPVLDMLRFHKLHIGKAWVPEYGDPDNPDDAKFLKKYSPYHNLTARKYPPTLLYTGLHDDRVHPAHAFKFAAKLEKTETPVFLRVETKSGHSGATPTTKVEEYSDVMAFIYKIHGIKA